MGVNSGNNTINCNTPFLPVRTYSVKLDYPNIGMFSSRLLHHIPMLCSDSSSFLFFFHPASDQDGQVGTWTLIYNQGVEIRINNVVYFAFSKYEVLNNGTAVSYCDQTMNGYERTHSFVHICVYTSTHYFPWHDYFLAFSFLVFALFMLMPCVVQLVPQLGQHFLGMLQWPEVHTGKRASAYACA